MEVEVLELVSHLSSKHDAAAVEEAVASNEDIMQMNSHTTNLHLALSLGNF